MRRRLESFRYAGRGIVELLRTQANARIHLAAAVAAVAAAWWLRITAVEWALVIVAIGAVFAAEAFNTAIETLCDAVQPDHSPLIERAKDVGAAGVLIAAIAAALVGLIVFGPRLLVLVIR